MIAHANLQCAHILWTAGYMVEHTITEKQRPWPGKSVTGRSNRSPGAAMHYLSRGKQFGHHTESAQWSPCQQQLKSSGVQVLRKRGALLLGADSTQAHKRNASDDTGIWLVGRGMGKGSLNQAPSPRGKTRHNHAGKAQRQFESQQPSLVRMRVQIAQRVVVPLLPGGCAQAIM